MKTINDVSFSMLRGGFLVVITLLLCAISYILRVNPNNLTSYDNATLADMMVEMIPSILIMTIAPAVYIEWQYRQGKVRE